MGKPRQRFKHHVVCSRANLPRHLTEDYSAGIRGNISNMSCGLPTCRVSHLKVLPRATVTSCLPTCMRAVFSVSPALHEPSVLLANYGISDTGEDALANLSIERTEAGGITGHVRIRSKTQGIALSLGDRITMSE